MPPPLNLSSLSFRILQLVLCYRGAICHIRRSAVQKSELCVYLIHTVRHPGRWMGFYWKDKKDQVNIMVTSIIVHHQLIVFSSSRGVASFPPRPEIHGRRSK